MNTAEFYPYRVYKYGSNFLQQCIHLWRKGEKMVNHADVEGDFSASTH